ncbi:Beta-lactamase-like protein 2 [Chytriomyces hyalinus]|nr:Beta-lactamase-like protein 2 [Chytriomyces hyalinus]
MEALVALPHWAVLSPLVTVIRGLNPGRMTLQGTNTYLIGTGAQRLLVDSGEDVPEYLPLLRDVLRQLGGISISHLLITHRHRDHTGGIRQVLETSSAPISVWKRLTPRDPQQQAGAFNFNHIADNQLFKTEGATLRAIYTPGHTDDHIVFHLEEEDALFSGDSVLGQGSTTYEDLKQYMDSLKRTLEDCAKIDRIYPAHGPDLVDGRAVVEQYIQHRVQREQEILAVVTAANASISSRGIVEIIYAKYNPEIWPAAEHSVKLHLQKLIEEKRLIESGRKHNALYSLPPSDKERL